MKVLKPVISIVTLFSFFVTFSLWTPLAQAGMVSTKKVIVEQQLSFDKEELRNYFSKTDTKETFLKLGVNPKDVEKRIDSMTPAELADFNQQAADLPAGSSAVGTVVLIVVLFVVIFIITDIIGATDIFPFIHPI